MKKTMQYYLRTFRLFWKKRPSLFAYQILSGVFNSLAPLFTIYCTGRILSELSGAKQPEVLRQWVLMTLVGGLLIFALAAAFHHKYKQEYNTFRETKWGIFLDKNLSLDYQDIESGKRIQMASDIDQNMNYTGAGFVMAVWNLENFFKSLAGIVIALVMSAKLFTHVLSLNGGRMLIDIGFLIVFFLLIWGEVVTGVKRDSYFIVIMEKAKEMNRIFGFYGFEGFNRQRGADIRIYRQDNIFEKVYEEMGDKITESMEKYFSGPAGAFGALSFGLNKVLLGICYVYVAAKAYAGFFGIGELTVYIGALTSLSGAVSEFFQSLGKMKSNTPFLEKSFAYLDIPKKLYRGSLTVEKRQDRNYEVEFHDVSFRYPGTEDLVLDKINLKFHIGKRLAIVGENGSGKSTFIKLLCRLYDPDEGMITLNGIDIKKYDYEEYKNLFSVVFQDFKLFAFPLGENVAGKTDYDKKRVIRVLEAAGLDLNGQVFPKGLDTYLYKDFTDEGVQISGGEAQKIAIGRALHVDKPFLILDEPTAALDPIAEKEIYEHLGRIVEDRTAVFISHRLSSCRFADEIVVFKDGRIVQQGTHEKLLEEENKEYAKLWWAQAAHYIEESA